jgi:hypothetical protein
MYTVYMHTTPNGKKYIGITQQHLKERWKNGKGYDTQYFGKAVRKYGWENIKHEVLFENLTKEQAEQKEVELIAFYKSNDIRYGYNIENGGTHNTCSEETKRKMSESQKALNKTIPDWHREINRQAQLGRKQSQEEIAKRVAHYKGKSYVMSEYQHQRILEAMKKISPEKRSEQIRKCQETKRSRTYNTKRKGKRIIKKDIYGNIVKEYISIMECCRENKYDPRNIHHALKKKRIAYGYYFEVIEDSK